MNHLATKNEQVFLSVLEDRNVELYIKREDKIHPFVSGNKFRKLKYNLEEAKRQKKEILLTFGGAFSNHIVATAVAGKLAGFKTIGIIRGDELKLNLDKTLRSNSTLREAHKNGMELEFVSREDYRKKADEIFISKLKEQFGNFYLIPEGGMNKLGVEGCEEILTSRDDKFDYICVAVGTGGTISGLINSSKEYQKIIGFSALKGDFLKGKIKKFSENIDNWKLINEYHFGGYGKHRPELIRFINKFRNDTNIPLDPIYTGKMLFGIIDLITKNQFSENTKILAIHTGGLQGIDGLNKILAKKNQKLIDI